MNLVSTNVNGVPSSYSAASATYGSGYQYLRVDVGDAHASVSPSTGISSQCSSRKESCPTGKVILSAPGTSLDGMSLQLNNEGYAQIAAPVPGTYSVTATYHGDASFAASSATTSFTIAKAPTTVSAGFGTTIEYGNQADATADILTTSDGIAPTGTFQFYVDGSPLSGPQGIDESFGYGGFVNGTFFYATADADLLTHFLIIGNHTISAQYSGDANYAAGTAPPTTFAVVKATPDINGLRCCGNGCRRSVRDRDSIHPRIATGSGPHRHRHVLQTTTSPSQEPSATTSNVSPPFLNASMPVIFSTPGTYPITASYSGDANYTAATTSGSQSLIVLGPISVTRGAGIVVTNPGLGGTTSLSVTPNGGFSGTATVSCTPDPNAKETTCNLVCGSTSGSTLQVNVSGSGASMTFNVTTTAAHQARLDTPSFDAPSRIVLAGMLALFLPVFRRRPKYFLCFLGLFLTLGLGACGGSSISGGGGGGGGSNTIPALRRRNIPSPLQPQPEAAPASSPPPSKCPSSSIEEEAAREMPHSYS